VQWLWAVLLLGLVPKVAWGLFDVTPIDIPGATETVATGINNMGVIVGSFTDATGTHAFQKAGVSVSTFDVPGALRTEAFGINDAFQVVGRFTTHDPTGTSIVSHGFLRSGGLTLTINVPDASSTEARGINNDGAIVGFFTLPNGNTGGFIIAVGDVLTGGTPLVILHPSSALTKLYGLSNSLPGGEVNAVGDSEAGAFVWSISLRFVAQPFLDFDVTGAIITLAAGVNTQGQIVGGYLDPLFKGHGFFTSEDTLGFSFAEDVPPSLGSDTDIHGINDHSQVVGEFRDIQTGHFRGFVANLLH
jgi:uncharacterized membrane protein